MMLRQTYYDKVYNYRPAWIVRWGLSVIFAIMLAVFIASWYIKYPDKIDAVAEITTVNPPSNVAARVNGKLAALWTSDGETVEAGDHLAMLETTVDWDDVKNVRKYITYIENCIKRDKLSSVDISKFRTNMKLGELQPYYNAMISSYNEYRNYRKYSYTKKEITSTQNLISAKRKYLNKQHAQKSVYNEIYSYSQKDLSRDRELLKSDIISESEYEQNTMGLLQKEATIKELDLSAANTTSDIRQMEYNIKVLQAKDDDERNQLIINIKQSLSQLSAQIDIWQQNYIITAPISGNVAFTKYWAENQNINAGDVVLTVVPSDSMQTRVRIRYPMANAGKVRIGHRVNIKLENYPYTEFGFLQGKVASISSVPSTDYLYSADVVLDNGLVTSYNKRLDSNAYLKGTAEILTDDYSLLLRLFNPIKAFMDEKINSNKE